LGFQSDIQLNRYRNLKEAFLISEKKSDPFDGLEQHYDLDLVERVRDLYLPTKRRCVVKRELALEAT